jgi:hypothetical protein
MRAIWRIPKTDRYVWIATEGPYHGGENILTNLGRNFVDRRDRAADGADTYGEHADKDAERLLFVKTRVGRQNVIKFVGVFKPDLDHSKGNVSAWERMSDECLLPDGSWSPEARD